MHGQNHIKHPNNVLEPDFPIAKETLCPNYKCEILTTA